MRGHRRHECVRRCGRACAAVLFVLVHVASGAGHQHGDRELDRRDVLFEVHVLGGGRFLHGRGGRWDGERRRPDGPGRNLRIRQLHGPESQGLHLLRDPDGNAGYVRRQAEYRHLHQHHAGRSADHRERHRHRHRLYGQRSDGEQDRGAVVHSHVQLVHREIRCR